VQRRNTSCGWFLVQGIRLALWGVLTGVVAALVTESFVSPMLSGVTARDPFIFVGVGGLLLLVSLIACYVRHAEQSTYTRFISVDTTKNPGCVATFAGKLMFGRVGATSATEILMLPITGVARKA
jgi:hypothetical protein